MQMLFGQFARDLLGIANARSANADPGLGICNGFARNGALSNGGAGNPYEIKGFPDFGLGFRNTYACVVSILIRK